MTHPAAAELIDRLSLVPHPEGGYYREVYRAADMVRRADQAQRAASTAIHYLLCDDAYSAWHRIASDEVWHFYTGRPVHIHVLTRYGGLITHRLGHALEHADAAFQVTVPAGCWFAAELAEPGSYALVGCTVAPGFEFSEFELGEEAALLDEYPRQAAWIRRLARRA